MALKTNDKRQWYRETYLKSDHWRDLRSRKLAESPVCEDCKSAKATEPHHLRYKSVYDVLLCDLVSVCRPCHAARHRDMDSEKAQERAIHSATIAAREIRARSIAMLPSGIPRYPIMKDRHGMLVATVKILQAGSRELRVEMESVTGLTGFGLLGAAVPDSVVIRMGLDPSRIM